MKIFHQNKNIIKITIYYIILFNHFNFSDTMHSNITENNIENQTLEIVKPI